MDKKLDCIKKRFEKDLTKWKPVPFWSWNDKLEPEELCRQIDWMQRNEIGGFFMHARGGLKTEYLSDEWMNCIKTCADYAENLGMDAWAYDENGWPSGFAGGKLLSDPENCDKYILTKIGDFDPEATVSYSLAGEALVRVNETSGDGEYLNLYIHTSVSTADILNPAVMDKFIALTHEAYKEYIGEDFSRKIRGFFTDEPQYYRANTPYTSVLEKHFKEQYNVDILDCLGLLFVKKEGYRTFRYRYWKTMQSLMLEAFAKKLYNWCEENGVSFTGHYIEENSLDGQMLACAGIMPFYKYMTMPGIDWLCTGADNETSPRQLASVAAQYGKKQTLTETFGCCGWEVSPRSVKRIADFQFVNGVNMLCHHLLPYAEYGQRKKDHPAHYSDVNPWVEREFADFNRYYTRLGHLLSESKEKINVAMLQPIRSTYMDYRRDASGSVADIDAAYLADCRLLSHSGVSYHLLDETLLAEDGFVDGCKIGCGLCSYDYLVLPHILATDAHTEKLLREYTENGGKLLVLGDCPAFCEGEPFDYSYLKSNCTLEDLIAAQPYSIENRDTWIYNTYREIDGISFMFIMNASTTECYTQTYNMGEGIKSFKKLDLISLSEKNVPLTVTLEPGESVLLFPDTALPDGEKELTEYRFRMQNALVSCTSNQLTVDYVRYSEDGVSFSERYPVPGLFAKLLEDRYEGEIYFKYEFEVRTVPSRMTLAAEDCGAKAAWLNGKEFSFTEHSEKERHLLLADITELVQKGTNEYVVKTDWYQSEAVYYALFGENVTESLRNCLVYDSELEAVYVSGDFGVYSAAGYEDSTAKGIVFGNDFYIDVLPETVTEPTTEGFPFFAGSLNIKQKINLDTTAVDLRMDGTWQMAYVKINGKFAGKMLYNRALDISELAVLGENTVEIELVIGNRNLLGPHHLNGDGTRAYTSPYCFELTSTWHNGESEQYAHHYALLKLLCD
ncbi:MAG: hypothetical protein IKD04_02500 [Clostridia bacterium]|nr:hypothetical protein [Clostridia bacterium]